MTNPRDDYAVGYGRPPLKSRWKKGQSGNPHKKPKPSESTVRAIDRLLLSKVKLTLNGEVRSIPALAAIISQLQQKEISGSVRASRVLLKYKEFASRHADKEMRLTFIESEYTRAVGEITSGVADG
jgi:hypothetical protein